MIRLEHIAAVLSRVAVATKSSLSSLDLDEPLPSPDALQAGLRWWLFFLPFGAVCFLYARLKQRWQQQQDQQQQQRQRSLDLKRSSTSKSDLASNTSGGASVDSAAQGGAQLAGALAWLALCVSGVLTAAVSLALYVRNRRCSSAGGSGGGSSGGSKTVASRRAASGGSALSTKGGDSRWSVGGRSGDLDSARSRRLAGGFAGGGGSSSAGSGGVTAAAASAVAAAGCEPGAGTGPPAAGSAVAAHAAAAPNAVAAAAALRRLPVDDSVTSLGTSSGGGGGSRRGKQWLAAARAAAAAQLGPEDASGSGNGSGSSSHGGSTAAAGAALLPRGFSLSDVLPAELAAFVVDGRELSQWCKIGQGSYGVVKMGTWNQQPVALKMLSGLPGADGLAELDSPQCLALQKEVSILAQLRHPNVLLFMGVCLRPLCLVTEYCSQGSLADVLRSARQSAARHAAIAPWRRRVRMALDVAQGMEYLHGRRVLHRDLRPANLLLDRELRVKVGDFGLAAVLRQGETAASSSSVQQGGTNPRWMAPELLRSSRPRPTAGCDVYSFGMVLWELMTLREPFEGLAPVQVIYSVTVQGRRPEVPAPESLPGGAFPGLSQLLSLMQSCWGEDHTMRPGFTHIVARLRSIAATTPVPP